MLHLEDIELRARRVLIRVDFNVPLQDGRIVSDLRIRAALPTIKKVLAGAPASLMLLSHLGRPSEGTADPRYSLAPVAAHLSELLGRPVPLVSDWRHGTDTDTNSGGVMLLENVRFNRGELADDEGLSRELASLCDVFVMDAFGTAHRAQASTHGVARHAPVACAGPLLSAELEALRRAMADPARPLVAVIGGAKVSTRLATLDSLVRRVDQLIVVGGIANTCLAAAGYAVGRSLCEPQMMDAARRLLAHEALVLPTDVVVAGACDAAAATRICTPGEVGAEEMILDIGPASGARYGTLLAAAATIIWSGPPGVFELEPFAAGTAAVARAVADSAAFSIVGGGDTVAAIEKFGIGAKVSYISTGGGAFLKFLGDQPLPAVAMLEQRGGN